MKRIAVITKPNTENHATRLNVLSMLRDSTDFEVVECASFDDLKKEYDVVLVFGGDGTVLDAVRSLRGKETPILGVNLGNIGFLTAFEQNVNPNSVLEALNGVNAISRMLLSVNVCDSNGVLALNEVVIKTAGTRPITLEVSVDGKFVDSFHSDGLIISSPTGSTAYSLSAGGPILAPDVNALLIIPVCAHSLHSRPLVVSAKSSISVKLGGEYDAYVSLDGGDNMKLKKGESVRVEKSDFKAQFICSKDENFYKKLLDKMNRWGTTDTSHN